MVSIWIEGGVDKDVKIEALKWWSFGDNLLQVNGINEEDLNLIASVYSNNHKELWYVFRGLILKQDHCPAWIKVEQFACVGQVEWCGEQK
jgi:uncharacterized membrane protein YccF (DUF307 family)